MSAGAKALGRCSLDADVVAAFDDYVRVHGERLVRVAYLLTGDRQSAEDIVQNALASVLSSWSRLRTVSNLDAYVYTAVVHAQRRWWRRRWWHEVPTEVLPEHRDEGGMVRIDAYTDITRALAQLPMRQRAAIVLRYYEDLTEAQTAEILGCAVGTVKSQTSKALHTLRGLIAPDPVGAEASPAPRPGRLQARPGRTRPEVTG